MTFYGQEQPVEYGPESLFDPTMAQMVLNTRNNYINTLYQDYLRGREDLKEFNEKYGDFLSPISSDMDWYNKEFGGKIRDTVNKLYANGDLLRTMEGRAALGQMMNSLPYGEYAKKKEAAKKAELYIASRDALKKANMYNEDYERQLLGGQTLEEWDGSLGEWKATSASPYMDYEQKYGHLFEKMGLEYDPEESAKFPGMYVMTKNKDRMRAILSSSRPDLIRDPQYQYDLVKMKAANPGISDKDAARLLENEIIERNYKGGMQMTEDPIAKEERAYKHQLDLQNNQANNALELQRLKNEGRASKYRHTRSSGGSGSDAGTEGYRVTEEVHHDGLYNMMRNLGVRFQKLSVDDKNNLKRLVNKDGTSVYTNDPTFEEIEYSAASKNTLLRAHQKYMASLRSSYGGKNYVINADAQQKFIGTYGFNIRGTQAASFFKNKKVLDNGAIELNRSDIEKMQSVASLMAGSFDSRASYSDTNRIIDVFGASYNGTGNKLLKKFNAAKGTHIAAQWTFDENDPYNAITIVDKKGRTQLFIKGTARLKDGDDEIEVEQWMPIGLISNKAVQKGDRTIASDFALESSNRSAYSDIDAEYSKDTGSQKQNNISLITEYQ